MEQTTGKLYNYTCTC